LEKRGGVTHPKEKGSPFFGGGEEERSFTCTERVIVRFPEKIKEYKVGELRVLSRFLNVLGRKDKIRYFEISRTLVACCGRREPEARLLKKRGDFNQCNVQVIHTADRGREKDCTSLAKSHS